MPASANLSISEDDLCSYRFRLHINFGLTLCSNGFGVFMILRHSPPEMGPYRWHLMNIIAWTFIFDLFLAVLIQPYPLLPLLGICPLGLFHYNGFEHIFELSVILCIFLEVLITGVGSIYMALVYRLSVLFSGHNSGFARFLNSNGCRALFGTIMLSAYAAVAIHGATVYRSIAPRMPEIQANISREFPGLRHVFSSNLCIVMPPGHSSIMGITMAMIAGSMIGGFLSGLATIWLAIWLLYKRRKWISPPTFRMHRNFIIALCLQIVVPFAAILLPMASIVLCIWFNLSWFKEIDNFMAIVCASHSTLNMLVMVGATHPYAKTIKQWLTIPLALCYKAPKSNLNTADTPAAALARRRITPIDLKL